MSTPAAARQTAPNRMTLASVTRGRIEAPLRVLLMGVPGVGKSTFASQAPSPIYLGATAGESDELDVARFPLPETWTEVLTALRSLSSEKHDYKTLVIDTLDSLEPLVWRQVVSRDRKATNIVDAGGGFQNGYVTAVDEWRVFMSEIDRLRVAGMQTILLAHCIVKNFKNPAGPDYERYVMKLEGRASGAFHEWVDVHLFAQFEGGVHEERGKKAKGWSNDMRVVHTRRCAAWDAKNRHGLPEVMALSWEEFYTAARKGREPEAIKKRVEEMILKLEAADAEKARAALVRANDTLKLAQLENWCLTKMPTDKENA